MNQSREIRRRRRTVVIGALALLVLAAVALALVWGDQSAAACSDKSTVKAQAAKSSTIKLKVYFVKNEKLVAVDRYVPRTNMVGTASLKSLLVGPTAAEQKAGFSTAIPAGTKLRGLSIKNKVATVDLTGKFATGGGTLSMYQRLGQIVYTITQFPTVDSVKIRLDGKDLRALGGEGLLIPSPIDRAAYAKLIKGASGGTVTPTHSNFKVYFVKDEKLVGQKRTVSYTPAVGRAAVTALLAGPTQAEKNQGLATAVPANVKINSLNIKNKVAIIDLSSQFASGGGSLSMYLRLGQLVYTLTEFPTVDRVELKLDGKTVKALGGEGLLLNGPLSRADWAKLIG